MFYRIKSFIRKLTPKFIISLYHLSLSLLSALFYRFPGRKIIVIGVTGTKGKTTIVELIGHILEKSGFKIALADSWRFKIGEEIRFNETKMTMPGRFFLQKFLRRAVSAGCGCAVLEVSSVGLDQHRHRFMDFDIAVFSNLHPEHLEDHGNSLEKYSIAKQKLFQSLSSIRKQKVYGDRRGKFFCHRKKISVVNLDDKRSGDFLKYWADKKIGFGLKANSSFSQKRESENAEKREIPTPASNAGMKRGGLDHLINPRSYSINKSGIKFYLDGLEFNSRLKGEFNLSNILASIGAGLALDIPLSAIREAIADFPEVAGRIEEIKEGQKFRVIVDFAHTPDSLELVYKLLKGELAQGGRLVAILGGTGGGRDRWKRPVMGKIAGKYCDEVIIANEDPYDENPLRIMEDVARGLKEAGKNYKIIPDRREAISFALKACKEKDILIITGKGSDRVMAVEDNKKIPWNDGEAVREEISKLF